MSFDESLVKKTIDLTNKLWFRYPDALSYEHIQFYIKEILPAEIECVKSDVEDLNRLPPLEKQECTLVMLVGFSIHPLLQSIFVYKPQKVILILNSLYGEYSGYEFGGILNEHINSLNEKYFNRELNIDNGKIECLVLENDSPPKVFAKLRQELLPRLRKNESIIIDITGGKKSMVAGTFLFGAFAGTDISYVDFDDYDPDSRRPLGYTCRIGLLQNPYKTFQLRDWERIRELYRNYHFRNTRLLVENIIPLMSEWFTEEEITATHILAEILLLYELWDSGDFSDAFDIYQKIESKTMEGLKLPTAVEKLGKNGYWPVGENAETLLNKFRLVEEGSERQSSLYLNIPSLIIYAQDELARIERLIKYNDDSRSALLRTAGLVEVLLKSRILILTMIGRIEVALNKGTKKKPAYGNFENVTDVFKEWHESIINAAIENATLWQVSHMRRLLFPGDNEQQYPITLHCSRRSELGFENQSFKVRFLLDENFLLPSNTLFSENESELRNKATHTYLFIPHSVAIATFQIAQNNVENFIEKWIPLVSNDKIYVFAKRLSWEKLCKICGIEFLPN